MDIWHITLQAMWLFWPGYFANTAPVWLSKWKALDFLAVPLDGGRTWRGKRIFGKNKTWRGLIVAMVVGVLFAYMQRYLIAFPFFANISILDYATFPLFWWGLLLGLGAMVGDALESMVKRQIGIKPGAPFVPFDQLDFVVVGLLFGSVLYVPPLHIIIALLIVSNVLHFAANLLAYAVGVKDVWY